MLEKQRYQGSSDNSNNPSEDRSSGALGSQAPSINLPKGGGAIRGIDEKFQINPSTGTASLSVSIYTSPGRQGFSPHITLNYDSGAGNGPFGLGWELSIPSIKRKTDKGVPQYYDSIESDIFILSGAEDLVPALLKKSNGSWEIDEYIKPKSEKPYKGEKYLVRRYRPRIEASFSRIERWTNAATGEIHWESNTRENIKNVYGKSKGCRVFDPEDKLKVYKWLLELSYDDRGNVITYEYKKENTSGIATLLPQEKNRLPNNSYSNLYLKSIKYGNETPYYPKDNVSLPQNWFFKVVFDYGEHDETAPTPAEDQEWNLRKDSFSSYKSGFEIRNQRLCRRVMMFHNFTEMGNTPYLVRSTDFNYVQNPVLTKLISVTKTGYVRDDSGTYKKKSQPEIEFGYSNPEIDERVKYADRESLEDLPSGLSGGTYDWVDLDGEGISGILKEEVDSWFYKYNLGGFKFDLEDLINEQFPPNPPSSHHIEVDTDTDLLKCKFERAKPVFRIPSLGNLKSARQQVMDLAGDGKQDLVLFGEPVAGYFERGENDAWENLVPFKSNPRVPWHSPDLRLVDLDGDGLADIFISQNDLYILYQSKGKKGYGTAKTIYKVNDEEKGPTHVFSDPSQSIYLADVTGDGLSDLFRITNGEVCYWPSLGYGRFGAKITMGDSPYFDHPDHFDQRRIRLADIDGSGTTDIFYLGRDKIHIWFNQAGNSWSEPQEITVFPHVDNLSSITVTDLLGNGTACLVWSSPLPRDAEMPLRYIDLMGGVKPHLLTSVKNNMGAETKLDYAPSTKFYLEDKARGTPWITKLPFPIHVLERVEFYDHISRSKFISLYKYHDGYFDGEEREFRGFGLVEQWDTEHFNQFNQEVIFSNAADEELHQSPVYTKTWLHTGAYVNGKKISQQFEENYYNGDPQAKLLPDTKLPTGLTDKEEFEAARALKGSILRQELYSVDESEERVHPYTVSEYSYKLNRIQPASDDRFAVFYSYQCEAIDYNYERIPDDPRITHAMTFEVDDFGNVTKAAAVAYPRRKADPALSSEEQKKQKQIFITYTEDKFVNEPDKEDWYRIGVPVETKTYEITGKDAVNNELMSLSDLYQSVINAGEISYEEKPKLNTVEKRSIEHSRTLYLKDELTAPLPMGKIDSRALPYKSYTLAFTPGILDQVFIDKFKSDQEKNSVLVEEGKYADGDELKAKGIFPDNDASGNFWNQTGYPFFSSDPEQPDPKFAEDNFFLPQGFKDPFENTSIVEYDKYKILLVKTIDPLDNVLEAKNNYRTLQTEVVIDQNGNRGAVVFDTLGLVVATAVMGKENQNKGDTLEGLNVELDASEIDHHIENPFDSPNAVLKKATTRFIFDLNRFKDKGKPNVVYLLVRETHESELGMADETKIQHRFTYSDGFGREIMTKVQAEPGGAPLRNEDGVLIRDGSDQIVKGHVEKRWVGNGRTVFNNKGNPVKQYEPFFDSTHVYNEEAEMVEMGVTPITHYDALSRVIRTDFPNGTFSIVQFDPWKQISWDQNDTVLDSSWYEERGSPVPSGNEPNDNKERAAYLAAQHANTPSVSHFDTLGRPFLTIDDNGQFGKYKTFEEVDVEGITLWVRDAHGNKVVELRHSVNGETVYTQSMDSDKRWILKNIAKNPIRVWDSRGHVIRIAYDQLQRQTRTYVKDSQSNEYLAKETLYGESAGLNGKDLNIRGQIYKLFDNAGVSTNQEFDFKGNLIRSTRELLKNYKDQVNWDDPPEFELDVFETFTEHDALSRPVEINTPDGSTIKPKYNEANLLEELNVNLRGSSITEKFLKNMDYDERGQKKRIEYGNKIITEYEYDEQTFHITHIKTTRTTDGSKLQDLRYTYDPHGNITQIRDDAQQINYFNNSVVEPETQYEYDPLYRLIKAKGREHIGQAGNDSPEYRPDLKPEYDFNDITRSRLSHPHDGNAMRRYTESYSYDNVGNIEKIIHSYSNGGWTRHYGYEQNCNRLRTTNLPGDGDSPDPQALPTRYEHDPHGNMTKMPHLAEILWDFEDKMKEVDLGGGGKIYYVYDASGQRARKVHEHNGSTVEEKIYLGGFEIYRKRNGQGLKVERETLDIINDSRRIALVETKTHHGGSEIPNPVSQIRYQFDNHLGSASLELDQDGKTISYEEYHPYGTTSYQAGRSKAEVSLKKYMYAGKERDEETGFYYHGARYYAPWLARWTAADPIGIGDGLNLYSYVSGNPVVLLDPDGRENKPVTDADRKIMQMEGPELHSHLKSLSPAERARFARSATGAFANRAWKMLNNYGMEIGYKMKEVNIVGERPPPEPPLAPVVQNRPRPEDLRESVPIFSFFFRVPGPYYRSYQAPPEGSPVGLNAIRQLNGQPAVAVANFSRDIAPGTAVENLTLQTVGAMSAAGDVAAAGGLLKQSTTTAVGVANSTMRMTMTLDEIADVGEEVYKNSPLLQRLTSAQKLTGQARQRELIDILSEFEKTTGLTVQVVEEGSVQAARGTGNLASLRSRPGVLQIEQQVFRDSDKLLGEITHELSAHAAWQQAGGIGKSVPRVGETSISMIDIIEGTVKKGQRVISRK